MFGPVKAIFVFPAGGHIKKQDHGSGRSSVAFHEGDDINVQMSLGAMMGYDFGIDDAVALVMGALDEVQEFGIENTILQMRKLVVLSPQSKKMLGSPVEEGDFSCPGENQHPLAHAVENDSEKVALLGDRTQGAMDLLPVDPVAQGDQAVDEVLRKHDFTPVDGMLMQVSPREAERQDNGQWTMDKGY